MNTSTIPPVVVDSRRDFIKTYKTELIVIGALSVIIIVIILYMIYIYLMATPTTAPMKQLPVSPPTQQKTPSQAQRPSVITPSPAYQKKQQQQKTPSQAQRPSVIAPIPAPAPTPAYQKKQQQKTPSQTQRTSIIAPIPLPLSQAQRPPVVTQKPPVQKQQQKQKQKFKFPSLGKTMAIDVNLPNISNQIPTGFSNEYKPN